MHLQQNLKGKPKKLKKQEQGLKKRKDKPEKLRLKLPEYRKKKDLLLNKNKIELDARKSHV
jgi:hypothetical protein|tara:strand:+ start:266 stop:448 length:183 start_codon:yes stop_codon:yes gene_type:complete